MVRVQSAGKRSIQRRFRIKGNAHPVVKSHHGGDAALVRPPSLLEVCAHFRLHDGQSASAGPVVGGHVRGTSAHRGVPVSAHGVLWGTDATTHHPLHPGRTPASGQDGVRVPWEKSSLQSPVSLHDDRRESLPAVLRLQAPAQGDGDRNAERPHETGSPVRPRPCLGAEGTRSCDQPALAGSAGPPGSSLQTEAQKFSSPLAPRVVGDS